MPWSRARPLVVLLATAIPAAACAQAGASQSLPLEGETPLSSDSLTTSAMLERAAIDPPSSAEAAPSACPDGMVLAEGEYCPEVEHRCLEWMDPPTSRYAHFRCARYARDAQCKKPRVHKRYCIDVTERMDPAEDKPRNHVSFVSARALCAAAGARVCTESEWQFACEGEEMRPYPYGWERDETACNTDRTHDLGRTGRLVDHRQTASDHPRCKSPFGVMDMAGNLEEWVASDGTKMGWRQVLKGSWWIPSRHACRSFQIGHHAVYGGTETGTRCCADAAPTPSASP